MRKGAVVVAALLAVAGTLGAGYLGAKHYGESRLRDTMNTLVAGSSAFANIRYGTVAFDPLARRATVDDVTVSWPGSDMAIGRTVLDGVGLGGIDPEHGRFAFRAVTDHGFFNGLLGWIAGRDHAEGFAPRNDAWAEIRYDLVVEYDVDRTSRSLTVRKLEWSAPDWGDLVATLDVTHLPEPLSLPPLDNAGPLEGPLVFLKALVAGLPDLGPTLIRGATLAYRDHGGVNRIVDGYAGTEDAQIYFLDLRDSLKQEIAGGKAPVWDSALLEILLGKSDLAGSATPQSPVPLARIFRLPDDAAGTSDALALKIATSGKRDLGRFAITETEERVLRARPLIETGESRLALPDVPSKFVALSSFQQAATMAPGNPRAAAGIKQAIAALIAEGQAREHDWAFLGANGAIALYEEVLRRVPDCQEAKDALAAVPEHIAFVATRASSDDSFVGADMAYDLLTDARAQFSQDPAVKKAIEALADHLVNRGDFLASIGVLLDDGRKVGSITYYRRSLDLQPGNLLALHALDTLGERLKQGVAQQLFAGDKAGATARLAAVREQWPELPGKTKLEADLTALLTPPPSTTVQVYNWSDYIGEFTNQRFQQKTGISVRYDIFDSSETLERNLLAGNSSYDVVVPSSAFLARQIPAGIFRKLDKSKLPNLANIDPAILKASEASDPGHEYSVPYFWGTVGFGYNIAAIRKRMPDAPVDSWRMVFDPTVVARFKDCGVTMLDAPSDVLQSVLIYLGLDPHTEDPKDYEAAERALAAVRPYIRYFHSSSYINDIANGEICLAVGWNGDFGIAQSRADEARNRVKLRYVVPQEGALVWMDNLAIPADAPHPDAALAYIDYLLDAQVAANNANYVHYASPNQAAIERGLINAEDVRDPAIYPPAPVMAKLAGDRLASPELDQLRTRVWAEIKLAQ